MKRFLLGFKYAYQGVKYAYSTQINFKVHTGLAILAIILGFYLSLSRFEWICVFASIALVMISELFNTALEVLVDLISPGYHPKAGAIKDLASAAVLLTALLALIVGLIIFTPKLSFLLMPYVT